MRLPKERPTERKVTESWGFSGNRKEEKNLGKKREKNGSKEETENSVLETRGQHLRKRVVSSILTS